MLFFPRLPGIAHHCPALPTKKMLQAVVASQSGRGSRGPGRVPRAALRQPGCTVEPTNHEPRPFLARGASRREFRGFHESRNTAFPRAPREPARNPRFSRKTKNKKLKTGFEVFTNHETRITALLPCRQVRRLQGGCTKRCVNEWKGVYLNPERKITTFSESRLGSRPGISHYFPQCVGKIRISPCRPSSASAHCGNRDLDFMDVSSRRITSLGPQVAPSGEVKGERATNRETQPLTRRAAQASANSEVFTNHESRNTNHGFLWRGYRAAWAAYCPPRRRPCPVRRSRSASRRAPFAGNPGKVYKIPLPPGKCVKRSARCGSRRPPGCFRVGRNGGNERRAAPNNWRDSACL